MKKLLLALAAAVLSAAMVSAKPVTCNAGKYVLCPEKELKAKDSKLDHVDVLGYTGMAFRIHALPRMMLCRSTVVCRYGYQPKKIKTAGDADTALQLAVDLAKTASYGEYVSGAAAYQLWISLLEASENSLFMREQVKAHKNDGGLSLLNTNCYQAFVHARSAAAPFLRRRAGEFSGEKKELILKAADTYAEIVKTLKSTGRTTWKPADRKRQAGVMRKAMKLEAEAAAYLKKALIVTDAKKGTTAP